MNKLSDSDIIDIIKEVHERLRNIHSDEELLKSVKIWWTELRIEPTEEVKRRVRIIQRKKAREEADKAMKSTSSSTDLDGGGKTRKTTIETSNENVPEEKDKTVNEVSNEAPNKPETPETDTKETTAEVKEDIKTKGNPDDKAEEAIDSSIAEANEEIEEITEIPKESNREITPESAHEIRDTLDNPHTPEANETVNETLNAEENQSSMLTNNEDDPDDPKTKAIDNNPTTEKVTVSPTTMEMSVSSTTKEVNVSLANKEENNIATDTKEENDKATAKDEKVTIYQTVEKVTIINNEKLRPLNVRSVLNDLKGKEISWSISKESIKCEICAKQFKRKGNLTEHTSYMHTLTHMHRLFHVRYVPNDLRGKEISRSTQGDQGEGGIFSTKRRSHNSRSQSPTGASPPQEPEPPPQEPGAGASLPTGANPPQESVWWSKHKVLQIAQLIHNFSQIMRFTKINFNNNYQTIVTLDSNILNIYTLLS